MDKQQISQIADAIARLSEERDKLTQDALDTWLKVEEFITDRLDSGTIIVVEKEGAGIVIEAEVRHIQTNVGTYRTIVYKQQGEDIGDWWAELPSKPQFGGRYYVHGDFNCPMYLTTRETAMHILCHAPEIIREVRRILQKQVDDAREGKQKVEEASGSL